MIDARATRAVVLGSRVLRVGEPGAILFAAKGTATDERGLGTAAACQFVNVDRDERRRPVRRSCGLAKNDSGEDTMTSHMSGPRLLHM